MIENLTDGNREGALQCLNTLKALVREEGPSAPHSSRIQQKLYAELRSFFQAHSSLAQETALPELPSSCGFDEFSENA